MLPFVTVLLVVLFLVVIFIILPLSVIVEDDGSYSITIVSYSVAFARVLYTAGISLMTILISAILKKAYEIIIEKGSKQ
ncbi:MAG: hypothetical protein FWG63_10190 [Defluviitaleaceae bacterium]|nr:hypothetical protein [Defluviitaleaceae bacterium]